MNNINISLILYAIAMIVGTFIFTNFKETKESFLVADRNIEKSQCAFSISATWIWAPALFVASSQSYLKGWQGFAWFFIPNILTLILCGNLSLKIREKFPNGYTLPEYMGTFYSKRVKTLYNTEMIILAILSMAVQFVAGGKILALITGISFLKMTVLLGIIALTYSLFSGIKASIFTDYLQMILMLAISIGIVPILVFKTGGIPNIINGLGGINRDYFNLFSRNGWELFLTFGLTTTIGLLSGPIGDQSFWQRTFTMKKSDIKSAYKKAAIIFAIIPFLMALIGFAAAGNNYIPLDNGIVNLEFITKHMNSTFVIFFIIMLISGLSSTLDSNLCAISSIVAIEIKKGNPMLNARISMILLTIAGLLIANVPGVPIVTLFLIYGVLRTSVFASTVITILSEIKYKESNIFYGILIAMIIGVPMFVLGTTFKNQNVSLFATLFTLIFPYLIIKIGGQENGKIHIKK